MFCCNKFQLKTVVNFNRANKIERDTNEIILNNNNY